MEPKINSAETVSPVVPQAQTYQAPPTQIPVQQPVQMPKGPSKMLDSFGWVFMFITMYLVSASIGMMLHYHTEKAFPIIGNQGSDGYGMPDIFSWFILEGIGSSYGVISPVIPYIATLIVVYPFFAILFLLVNKRTLKDPSLRHLKSRRYFIYFTLVVTFLFMLYKLISLVMNLLTGNGTMNFISHFVITVGINFSVFAYCLLQLVEDRKNNV